jgi:hypothetical protein
MGYDKFTESSGNDFLRNVEGCRYNRLDKNKSEDIDVTKEK